MVKYQQYAEYKDSGVEWVDDIPSGWSIERIKRMLVLNRNLVGTASNEYQLLSLTLKGVIPRDISSGEGKIPASFDTYQEVGRNDLVFCLFDIDETPRTIGLSPSKGMITGAYNVYQTTNKCLPSYAYYYFLYIDLRKGLRPFYTGLRKVVRSETFSNIEMPCPSYEEQTQIANFLDYETAQIDTLIEKQQTLIQLLKEKRQAVISHAVTKGLNPDAPMKESGIEWLGEVPEHWEVLKLGNYAIPLNGDRGANYPSGNDFVDEGVLFISATQVIDGRVETSNASKITLKKYNQLGGLKIKKGDILYCLRGAGVGKSGICTFAEGSISSSLMGVRATSIDPYYLMLLLNSSVELQQRSVLVTGSVSPNLSAQNVMDYKFAIPKDSEQLEIIAHVKNSLKKIDILLNKAEQAIHLMQERRTALISAAVTGKIDVRGWEKDQ